MLIAVAVAYLLIGFLWFLVDFWKPYEKHPLYIRNIRRKNQWGMVVILVLFWPIRAAFTISINHRLRKRQQMFK